MVAPTEPAGVTAQGNSKILFTLTASLTAPSLAAINGAGSLDVSNMFYTWQPTAETNKVTPPRRVGSKRQYQKDGLTTEAIGDLTYVVDPQGAAASEGKEAYETLVDGTTGYFVERLGKDVDDDFAVGDFVIVRHIVLGFQHISGDTTDEAAEYTVTQSVSLLAPGSGPLVALVV